MSRVLFLISHPIRSIVVSLLCREVLTIFCRIIKSDMTQGQTHRQTNKSGLGWVTSTVPPGKISLCM
jgi:hypothetical protein